MKRFWAKVDKQGPIKSPILGPCWEWMAGLSTDGYGQFWYNGRNRRAHIVAWLLTGKTLPEGLEVCHHCDNPACVRDSHLFIGTHTDNFLDAVEKGRISKGENQHCAMLTENAVRAIRQIDFDQFSSDEVAALYHVTRQTINKVRFRQTWKHVT